jgi:hypothetical protein
MAIGGVWVFQFFGKFFEGFFMKMSCLWQYFDRNNICMCGLNLFDFVCYFKFYA